MQKTILFLFATLIATAGYADYTQNVQVCVNVNKNDARQIFQASFVSSDVFDRTKRTSFIASEKSCVSHTYNHGPKNIKLGLTTDEYNIHDVLIMRIDDSCSYMYAKDFASRASDYQATSQPNETWTFNITQAPPMSGYKYVYNMTCQHENAIN